MLDLFINFFNTGRAVINPIPNTLIHHTQYPIFNFSIAGYSVMIQLRAEIDESRSNGTAHRPNFLFLIVAIIIIQINGLAKFHKSACPIPPISSRVEASVKISGIIDATTTKQSYPYMMSYPVEYAGKK